MSTLTDQLKSKEFSHMILLYGAEDFLKRTYKQRLKAAMVGEDDMNFSYYEGKDIDFAEVKDVSDTMPFFAERKLILIEDSGIFKSANDMAVTMLESAPDTTYFVFAEAEVDKRNKLYKTVNEKGLVCELKTLGTQELTAWLAKSFAASGKKITQQNMNYFLQKAGTEGGMDNLSNEAHKLLAYLGEKEIIEASDIDAICTTHTVDKVFDMLEAISLGDRDKAIRLYGDLVALKEPPIKILVLLTRQFGQMLAVKQLKEAGKSNAEISTRLGMQSFLVPKYAGQAGRFTVEELSQALEDCAATDQAIKTGRTEETYAVELLIVRYTLRRR